MEKSRKKKIIIISGAVLLIVVAVVIGIVLFRNQKNAYRIIKVYEINGNATVTRDGIGEMEVYQDMVLESGDRVALSSGEMTLRLDDDKYVYVEPDTTFRLVATGKDSNSKTCIELDQGAITSDIQNPLSKSSSYEVNAPNSNMSVRGTVFRVYTYYEDGKRYTKVSVFDGKVDSKLRYADGSMDDNSVEIGTGNEVLIYDDETETAYVSDPSAINYDDLPDALVKILKKIMKAGKDIGVSYDELDKHFKEEEGPFTVTFMYNGNIFGTQTVEKGGQASEPSLVPSLSGHWNFDFGTEINSDTTIEWR